MLAATRTRRIARRVLLFLLFVPLVASALYSQLPETFVRGYDRLVADLKGDDRHDGADDWPDGRRLPD